MADSGFVFFHGYDEKLWDGFVKHGLIDSASGVRFCQSLLIDEDKKFNRLAARDGKLFHLLHDNSMPWYIDRLQGGCYFDDYPYDMSLIDSLGEKFYGFQMHEWASNMRSDYGKLRELSACDWTEEKITREIFRRFPFSHIFLEAACAKEYAEDFPVPKCFEEMLVNLKKLYIRRSEYTQNRLLPCDSVMLATKLEFESGAQRVMPEIGAQTPCANIQIAYARGMAKAYGKSFGTYYEPWGGNPFSVCAYQPDSRNEWNIGTEGDFPFQTCGGEGGSSRSLQRRLYLYSYLAGASFISEEWGLFNTFLDCEDFELSPYGEVKRDFLGFASKYPAGEFYAPIAIVLPADMPILSSNICDDWFGNMPWADSNKLASEKNAAEGLRELMFSSESKYGNEKSALINSAIPDAFDIVHEDCDSVLPCYSYLVDLTGNPAFAKNHRNAVSVAEAKRLIFSLMPCTVSGDVHWFVNKLDNCRYLTIFNNDGIDKSVDGGEKAISDAARTAVVELPQGFALTRLEGCTDITAQDGKYFIKLKPGETFFARIS